jgi:hypothetical protein
MSSSTGLERAGDNAGAVAEPLLASALIAVLNITPCQVRAATCWAT